MTPLRYAAIASACFMASQFANATDSSERVPAAAKQAWQSPTTPEMEVVELSLQLNGMDAILTRRREIRPAAWVCDYGSIYEAKVLTNDDDGIELQIPGSRCKTKTVTCKKFPKQMLVCTWLTGQSFVLHLVKQ